MIEKIPNQTRKMMNQAGTWDDTLGRAIVCLCAALFLFLFSQTAQAQSPVPIPISSGFNADIIADASALSPAAGTSQDYLYGFCFFEEGAPVTGAPCGGPVPAGDGFPTNGIVHSTQGMSVQFQMQPYNGNNVLIGNGTLTLATPCYFYNNVEFLVDSGGGGSTWSVTLNFSDSTTSSPYTMSCNDWTAGGASAKPTGLIGQGSPWGPELYSGQVCGTLVHCYESDITLTPCDSLKTVSSISVTVSGNGAIFAVSAQTNSLPIPPATTNGPIVLDNFDGVNDTNGVLLAGRTPAEVDLPGGPWLANGYSTYGCCSALPNQIATTAIWGSVAPMALYGFDNWNGVSIASVPATYGKPSHFHISAEMNIGWMGGSGDTVRGWFLGFTPAGGPNGWIGYQGAGNTHGVWLSYNSGISNDFAIFLQDGNGTDPLALGASGGNWHGTNYILAFFDQSLLGSYNYQGWYTLAYDVDTVSGTITNITLTAAANGMTQQIPNKTISGISPNGFTDANTMIAMAGTSDGSTASIGVAGLTAFTVVGLPAVYHVPPVQPTPANILFDEFNGLGCGAVEGRTPDTSNLPGGTWSDDIWFGYLPEPSDNNSNGNPVPDMISGGSCHAWVPISSFGGYTRPTVLTISADIELGTISAGDVVRGIMLGFCSGTPTNHYGLPNSLGGTTNPKGEWYYAGHEGSDNFAGIYIDPAGGDLYLQQFNNSYLGKPGDAQAGNPPFDDVTNITPILAFSSSTNLGTFNANSWYHLSYQVNTTSGVITNVTLSNTQGTNTAAGSFQIYSNIWSSDANAVTLANAFNYAALQFCTGGGGGSQGYVDNFGISGVLAPFRIINVARVGNDIQLTWTATGGQTNVVQRSASLPGGFADISGNVTTSMTGTNSYTDVGGATGGARFYRVRVVP